jgi:hypothetical protein
VIGQAKAGAGYTTKVTASVDQLMQKVDSALSTEEARPANAPTTEQWKRIKSKLGEFFGLWKTKGKLSSTFVEEARKQITELFDSLIKTEKEKPRL